MNKKELERKLKAYKKLCAAAALAERKREAARMRLMEIIPDGGEKIALTLKLCVSKYDTQRILGASVVQERAPKLYLQLSKYGLVCDDVRVLVQVKDK